MKSNGNDVESIIKMVVSLDKDGDDGSTTTSASAPGDRHHQRVYEFYSGDANVTPREIISVRYPMKLCGETPCKNRILSTTHTYSWSHENYDDYFLKTDSKSFGDLLDDVLSYSRQRFGDEEPYETKYDVGPDIVFPGENTIANGHEIELTESPTFHILNVPNSVVVEGDGDYERIRKTDDVYRDNCTRTRAKTDTATQTVNASADRKDDAECQTTARSAGTVGTQLDGVAVVDGIGGNGRDARRVSAAGTSPADDFARTAMFVARIAAQNALMTGRTGSRDETPPSARVRLDYRFTLTRNGDGPAVSCTHWNEAETHLLAVAYGESICDDREDGPNAAAAAVAVWSTKNPYAPERFYEFDDESAAITCLRFSIEYPNRLAIGFDSGEILIIDIRNERLEIVFRKSKQSPPEINGVVGLFWTVRLENGLSRANRFECLVACNSRGGIERYRYWNETFDRKTICENDGLAENDERPVSDAKRRRPKSTCHATEFRGLDQNAYLVGTADGYVYTCTYDSLWCRSTRTVAHLGVIKSLEKSPHSPDVYLTTGCDCTVNIWMGDVFVEPVMALRADGQIEKAIWSRTNPTVVVSIVDDRLHVWDVDATTDAPVAVRELRVSDDRARCSDAEFTSDGRRLCVCDTGGNVVVYAWSDAPSPSARQTGRHCRLMCCVARSLYGKTYLIKTLGEQRPEYADVFAAVHDER